MGEHAFDVDTAVAATETPGRYTATVTDRWNVLGGRPNGGYLLGICLRALREELPDSHPDPLAVSAFFVRPGAVGDADLRAETIRVGRRITTGQVTLSLDGKETVRVVADFTDLATARGRTQMLASPPKLPAPEDCVDPTQGQSLPGITIADRFHYRYPEIPGWAKGQPAGEAAMEFWMRFSDGRPADTLSLPPLVDAAMPAVADLGEYATSTVELTVYVRRRPAPGWLACRVATRYLIDGYHEEDFEIWDTTGTLVAQGRQLAVLPSA